MNRKLTEQQILQLEQKKLSIYNIIDIPTLILKKNESIQILIFSEKNHLIESIEITGGNYKVIGNLILNKK